MATWIATCPACKRVTKIDATCPQCGLTITGWDNEALHEGILCFKCRWRTSHVKCGQCGHLIPVIRELIKYDVSDESWVIRLIHGIFGN